MGGVGGSQPFLLLAAPLPAPPPPSWPPLAVAPFISAHSGPICRPFSRLLQCPDVSSAPALVICYGAGSSPSASLHPRRPRPPDSIMVHLRFPTPPRSFRGYGAVLLLLISTSPLSKHIAPPVAPRAVARVDLEIRKFMTDRILGSWPEAVI